LAIGTINVELLLGARDLSVLDLRDLGDPVAGVDGLVANLKLSRGVGKFGHERRPVC
jgi:hypothetical protein